MRVKITISYDGSRYSGSARQPNKSTVLGTIEQVFSSSVDLKVDIMGSGRTDKGVHASSNVAHTDIPNHWQNRLDRLTKLLNRKLLPSICIKSIEEVESEFHSRFCAKRRLYRYVVSTGTISVFMANYITYVDTIDVAKIQEAIKVFEGVHDFEYFKKSTPDEHHFVREIYKCRFYKYKDFYIFSFEANAYLRSQIRMMVGFLLQISDGTLSVANLREQLSKQKQHSTLLAPPNGLYLAKVKY
jgi:tRNA pseudouridine38-40 synthase